MHVEYFQRFFVVVVFCCCFLLLLFLTKKKKKHPEDIPLVEFMYLAFTRMPGERYIRRLRSLLLYLCYVFRALINSLVC